MAENYSNTWQRKRQKELPTFYYHTHFAEFLDFVTGPSVHLLNSQQRAFLTQYKQAKHLEQCLLVRLINRKYPVIKVASLVFIEIPDVEKLLITLFDLAWVQSIDEHHVDDLLAVLTKPELITLYEQCASIDTVAIKKSANKATLVAQCKSLDASAIANSALAQSYVLRAVDHHVEYFLFLYFGHNNGKLNQFSMRDLGVMRTRDKQAQMQSRFTCHEDAFSCFQLQYQYDKAKRASYESAEQINAVVKALPSVAGHQAQAIFEKLMYVLAKHMLNINPEKAIKLVEGLQEPLAQEFWCRQAYKLDIKAAVKEKLEAIIDDPATDKLLQFAEDFLSRKFKQKRTSVLTDMLRENNRHLSIDETYKGKVEQGVIAHYRARDIQAWRTENVIWRNLFGLCFWQELFDIEGMGLATPFDYLPNCIKHHCFLEVAQSQIHKKLDTLKSSGDLFLLLTKNFTSHFGQSQGIIHWHNSMLDTLKILVNNTPLDALKSQLLNICKNWQLYNDGYPDIMVLENNALRFEEIKSQGDTLRRNQLMQLQSLRGFGIDVGITTVDWTFDPMQAYAVIDIETTGGRANTHKITEIGMVKIINGEVVEQWQSLLNPQRRIPSMITSLTGITNDMVSDAPLFADVADEVEAFTQNCIFVAHNVNFDYGFIREEFARLDRTYRRPKLCTVQQMRKYYSGLPSYSLANLTRHFNIDMQRHHRALSDAIAASELLKLVNEARIEKQTA